MKTAIELLEFIKSEESSYDFNDYLSNYIDETNLQEAIDDDTLEDYLLGLDEDGDITTAEVIYYANAIQYLAENDQSLQESIGIAADMGYDISSVNSGLLASLLKTENNKSDYQTLVNTIVEFCTD